MSTRLRVLGSVVLGFWCAIPGSSAHAQPGPPAPARTRTASYELADGRTISGTSLNHYEADDVQLRTDAGRIVLLRKSGSRYRVVTSDVDWSSYDGSTTGNRYTALTQINKSNVGRLAPKWVYTIPTATRLQVTPVVVDGINRGVAVAGDRVFMVTDHAHLIALNRFTGDLLWDTEMADWRQNYNATAAPLIVGDLVISGTAGGEQGVRGFLDGQRSSVLRR